MIYNVKQCLSLIKSRGYTSSRDALGVYFDKGDKRMSVMKQATWYTCFYNQKKGADWKPINKSKMFSDYGEALYWVIQQIEKDK